MNQITIHKISDVFNYGPPQWDERLPNDDGQFPGLHCSYCGSVTVEDAIKLMAMPGVYFSGADWKYGWPHKFYFDVPNPDAAKEVQIGSDSFMQEGVRVNRPIMGKRATLQAKFYNAHLSDANPDELERFSALSADVFGIHWGKDENGIWYRAPKGDSFYGHQLSGIIGANGRPDHSAMGHV